MSGQWAETEAAIAAQAGALGMGTACAREGVLDVWDRADGGGLGTIELVPDGGRPQWVSESPSGGRVHDTWDEALLAVEGNKKKVFVLVELEFAGPRGAMTDERRGVFDAAEEFLADALYANRDRLAPAGADLKMIKVGTVERAV